MILSDTVNSRDFGAILMLPIKYIVMEVNIEELGLMDKESLKLKNNLPEY